MTPPRVLLVDDHALVRDGIASLLRAWDFEVVGQASDGAQAIEQAIALQPDLVLMDIQMPVVNGLQATRQIKSALPGTKIVMLTVSEDENDLLEAVRSGAEGYLLKNMSGREFGDLLSGLARGVLPVSPSLASKLLQEFARQVRGGPSPKGADDLTEREKGILSLVAKGATNKEVARQLSISEHTVNYHMTNILDKLHVHNRAEAAVRAVRDGLVQPARGEPGER